MENSQIFKLLIFTCKQIYADKELGTVLTKICPVKINNQNIILWYLNKCNFKKWSLFIFIFNRISKIFNGNPPYLTDDVATLTLILTHIYEGSLKNVN